LVMADWRASGLLKKGCTVVILLFVVVAVTGSVSVQETRPILPASPMNG
jgi:hypothetical protein